jgi:hypothetical protein
MLLLKCLLTALSSYQNIFIVYHQIQKLVYWSVWILGVWEVYNYSFSYSFSCLEKYIFSYPLMVAASWASSSCLAGVAEVLVEVAVQSWVAGP